MSTHIILPDFNLIQKLEHFVNDYNQWVFLKDLHLSERQEKAAEEKLSNDWKSLMKEIHELYEIEILKKVITSTDQDLFVLERKLYGNNTSN